MKLIFVYNAKSGKLNALLDAGHKLISPKTYQCSLCTLTHGTFSENKIWKEFRTQSSIAMEFLHTDEFEKTHPNKNFSYPIILKDDNGVLSTFIDSKTLNRIDALEELITQINSLLISKPA
ncbi:GTPase [Winogradskyella immobilis]|uniref:GTPase n=1 Tax=Winogradskyella immobilis TaxID=2816852 RepID=A0ABS8EKD2_9FLAO|nr:GTPase [Winogradskyella immobilis]MCC1483035.1 GTPase [Winogradskyella immobilis]MCG0015130.1 GTPase [Winogradskyella immobilis]